MENTTKVAERDVFYNPEHSIRDVYWRAGRNIPSRRKLRTGNSSAKFIHDIYHSGKETPELVEARHVLKRAGHIWVYQMQVEGQKGHYVFEDPNAEGLALVRDLTEENLEQMLVGGSTKQGVEYSKDNRLRRAPKGSYNFGLISADKVASDGRIIAHFDVEGAKLVAEAASRFIHGLDSRGYTIDENQGLVQTPTAFFDNTYKLVIGPEGYDGGVPEGFAFSEAA